MLRVLIFCVHVSVKNAEESVFRLMPLTALTQVSQKPVTILNKQQIKKKKKKRKKQTQLTQVYLIQIETVSFFCQ